MSENAKKPRIRFKGFTDAWEQRKVNSIAEKFYGGGTPSTLNEELWQGDIAWIQSSDLIEHNVLDVVIRKRINEKAIKTSATQLIPPNSIAIITRVGVGKVAYMPISYATSQDFVSLSELNIDGVFATYLLYLRLQKDMNMVQGTSIKGITKEELLSKEIYIPHQKQEQSKIANIFSRIDKLITLHQRKFFMKKLDKIEEISLKILANDWEQRKLGDMGKTFGGLSGKTKDDFGHGEARFITYMNVFTNPIASREMLEKVEKDDKQNQVEYGDILFTTSSETPEEVGMSAVWLGKSQDIYLNSFCFGFRPQVHNEPYFMAYLLRAKSFRDSMMLLAQGISRYNISKNKAMEIEIDIPKFAEQELLGRYFANLDKLITLHQRKLEKLKNVKSALLEKMFV